MSLLVFLFACGAHAQSTPTILGISVTSGGAGSYVQVNGSNFGATQGSSTVTINGTSVGTANYWAQSILGVTLPAGLSSGNLVVNVGGVASNGIAFTYTTTPTIGDISPTSGGAGTYVQVRGYNFGASQGSSTVTINGTSVGTANNWAQGILGVTLPAGLSSGNLVVHVGGVATNGIAFTYTTTPTILGISLTSGGAGTYVQVNGSNFGATQGSNAVTINGTSVGTANSWAQGIIGVTLPTGLSSGNLVVHVGGAATNGIAFTYTTTPTIGDISPTSGGAGTYVQVRGYNFGASQGSSTVTINGTSVGTANNWAQGILGVVLPAGLSSGNLVVKVGGTASNGIAFTYTTPPSITSSVSPMPNSNGWVNWNATVTFTCTAGTYPIASCPSPQTVSFEGRGQIVSGTASDTHGFTASASVTINLDKTIPTLTVTSPADQTVESSSPVTVSATLTDALSGVSGVTCNGVTATLSGGVFSCNISLTVGVNLVIVRGTDIAGNIAGDNLHLSLTGSLPAPTSLQVTPTGVNMVVGGTQQFTAVDQLGRPRTDATWGVSSTSIATIDTSSSPTLTAVATGTATLTATVGTVTANTVVTIGSGTSLPSGTVIWSAPPLSGDSVLQITQAVPSAGGPALYSVEGDSSNANAITRGFTADGQQLWTSAALSGYPWGSSGDGQGGILVKRATFSPYSIKVTDLDAQTGAQAWGIDLSFDNNVAFGNSGLALGLDGTVYVSNGLSLLAVDGITGSSRTAYKVPPSIETDNYPPGGSGCTPSGTATKTLSDGDARPLFGPIVGPDGSVYAETYVRNLTYTFACSGSNLTNTGTTLSEALSLLQVSPNGSISVAPITTNTISNNGFYPDLGNVVGGVMIPDGTGGTLAAWQFYPNGAPVAHITDVSTSGTNDFTMSSLAGGIVSQMVLGDQGSGIAYANDTNHILAFHISNGSTAWMYTASGNGLDLVAGISGGSLNVTNNQTTTLFSLNSSGAASNILTSVLEPNYSWTGDLFGLLNSGAVATFAEPSQTFASNIWEFAQGIPSNTGTAVSQPVFPPLPSCPGATNPCAKEALGTAWNSVKSLVNGPCTACDTYVFNILGGTRADFYKYLNLDSPSPRFYDGTRSYANMNTTMCGNILRQLLTNCPFGSQTVRDYMAAHQADAISRTPSENGRGPLTFFDPAAISLTLNSTPNQALVFHEALHGKYGLYDSALENAFSICTNQGSIQISNYLERHVLGGTVLVCGQ